MRSRRLPGLPVLSITEGNQLGRVRRPVVDPKNRSVVAFVVATAALGGRRLLPISAVHALGSHAVTVHRTDALQPVSGDEALERLVREGQARVIGTPVVTKSGTLVGTVQDYEIGRQGEIEALYLSQSVWRTLAGGEVCIPGQMVIALGRDAAIVADEALSLRPSKQEQRETAAGPSARLPLLRRGAAAGEGAAISGQPPSKERE